MPKYVCIGIDIENTGKSLSKHAIVQIGARVMLVEEGKWERADTFNVLINVPSDRGWEERCVTEFWNSQQSLKDLKSKIDAKEGKAPEEAMRLFKEFLLQMFEKHAQSDINRIRLVTDTVSFDACWLNLYLDKYIDSDPLHLIFGGFRDLIESGSFMQGVSGITHDEEMKLVEEDTQKRKAVGKEGRGYFSMEKSLWKKRKIQTKSEAEHNHDAVSDATNIVENYLIAMYSANEQRYWMAGVWPNCGDTEDMKPTALYETEEAAIEYIRGELSCHRDMPLEEVPKEWEALREFMNKEDCGYILEWLYLN